MAKALFGHVGPDARLASELVRLRRRVRELEAEIVELRADEVVSVAETVRIDQQCSTNDVIELDRAAPALA